MEQWIKWEPISGLSRKCYIHAIFDSMKGFQVILSDDIDEKKKINIIFATGVDSYKRTDETFRIQTIDTLDKTYGTQFYSEWTFFKVKNSHYLKWLSEQSYTISDERDFIHFVIIAVDSMLDIITNYEPHIILVTE